LPIVTEVCSPAWAEDKNI